MWPQCTDKRCSVVWFNVTCACNLFAARVTLVSSVARQLWAWQPKRPPFSTSVLMHLQYMCMSRKDLVLHAVSSGLHNLCHTCRILRTRWGYENTDHMWHRGRKWKESAKWDAGVRVLKAGGRDCVAAIMWCECFRSVGRSSGRKCRARTSRQLSETFDLCSQEWQKRSPTLMCICRNSDVGKFRICPSVRDAEQVVLSLGSVGRTSP